MFCKRAAKKKKSSNKNINWLSRQTTHLFFVYYWFNLTSCLNLSFISLALWLVFVWNIKNQKLTADVLLICVTTRQSMEVCKLDFFFFAGGFRQPAVVVCRLVRVFVCFCLLFAARTEASHPRTKIPICSLCLWMCVKNVSVCVCVCLTSEMGVMEHHYFLVS